MAIRPPRDGVSRLTFDLPQSQRVLLDRLAASQGVSAGECLRRILAELFTRLQEEQG